MTFNVLTTSSFEKQFKKLFKKYISLQDDIRKLISKLETNPTSGTPLGKDCYKIRFAITSKRKGKSGGARLITCVKVTKNSVFLLSIYDKSEKESISDNQLNELLQQAGLL